MNHDTLERIARQLCEDAGRDYDADDCDCELWLKRAAAAKALGWGNPRPVIDALLRAVVWVRGWRI